MDSAFCPPIHLLEAADKMNEMLNLEPNAIDWIFKFHAALKGQELIDNSGIQTRLNQTPDGSFYSLGTLSIINNLLCSPPYHIVAIYDVDDTISEFRVDKMESLKP